MLLLTFATHQCACYTFVPKQLHEDALKHIGHQLKGTLDKGPILRPSDDFKIYCYPYADSTGVWNCNDKNDTHCGISNVQFYGLVSSRLKLHYQ